MSTFDQIYSLINWKDYPSTDTAIDEINLNKMDAMIKALADGLYTESREKLVASETTEWISNIQYSDGIFTVSRVDGTSFTIPTNIEKIAVAIGYDPITQELILYKDADKTQELGRVDLSALITEFEFEDSDTIGFTVAGGKVNAIVKQHSITDNEMETEYLANVQLAKDTAVESATTSKSWAVGGTGTREGEDTNNAKYWCDQARQGGGGGGTSDYTDLTNKPQINSVELNGNKSAEDLDLEKKFWQGTKAEYEAQKDSIEVGTKVIITDDFKADESGTYSLDEVVVGTWYNGKPIYRKVIVEESTNYTDTASSRRSFIFNSKLENVAEIIDRKGHYDIISGAYWQGASFPFNSTPIGAPSSGVTYLYVMTADSSYLNTSTHEFIVSIVTNAKNPNATKVSVTMVVEYTKTTD